MKSTPAKPLTWRSTKPGAAIAAAAAAEPDGRHDPARDLDVARHEPAVDQRRLDAEPRRCGHGCNLPARLPRGGAQEALSVPQRPLRVRTDHLGDDRRPRSPQAAPPRGPGGCRDLRTWARLDGVAARLGRPQPRLRARRAGGHLVHAEPRARRRAHWIDTSLTRRDITEDRAGVPLRIVFTVQDASTCRVIADADVEIWHADADGRVHGLRRPGSGRTSTRYLRGHQKTGAERGRPSSTRCIRAGTAGRTPHIHLKVHVGGDEVHTGQLFFRDTVSAAVYRTSHTARAARRRPATPKTASTSRRRGSRCESAAAGGYLGRMTLQRGALIGCRPSWTPRTSFWITSRAAGMVALLATSAAVTWAC